MKKKSKDEDILTKPGISQVSQEEIDAEVRKLLRQKKVPGIISHDIDPGESEFGEVDMFDFENFNDY